MHSFKESCAGAETRSTGTRRGLLRGRGAHPATARCASPSSSSSPTSRRSLLSLLLSHSPLPTSRAMGGSLLCNPSAPLWPATGGKRASSSSRRRRRRHRRHRASNSEALCRLLRCHRRHRRCAQPLGLRAFLGNACGPAVGAWSPCIEMFLYWEFSLETF